MRNPLEKRLGLYISSAALISLIASILTIYFFVGALNRNALETDQRLLTAGIRAAATQNENWATDYGWWDELLYIFQAGDTGFMAESMASPFEDHGSFDFVVLTEESEGRTYSWHRETGSKVRRELLNEETLLQVRDDLLQAQASELWRATHMAELNGHLYLMSATAIGEHADRSALDITNAPLIIIGTRMDKYFFDELGTNYLLENIAMVPPGHLGVAGSVPLMDLQGHAVGELIWSPSQPGIQSLRFALLPLVAYIALFLVAFQFLRLHVRKLGRRATNNERRARLAARRDSLSGLANRQGFTDFIEGPAAETAAAKGQAAIIYIDLNGFKAVNDKAGHHAGDAVIRAVAQRFRSVIPSDVLLARIGGDEFACVMIGEEAANAALNIARRLSGSLDHPVEHDGRLYDIGGAIGISWSTEQTPKSFDTLVEEADLAMYRAKAEQLDQPLTYDNSLGLEHNHRRHMEAAIEDGLANREFYVAYQPIMDANTGEVVSVEALLRWENEERGAVPPDVFIPVAERSKLIQKLGDFVIDTVCEDFDETTPHTISINLSPAQLSAANICHHYVDKLIDAGLQPGQIEIELTEAVLVDDFERARERLVSFSEAGFKLNLDDFGTGFAGMGYLHQIPFDKIKIDKSFVRSIGKGDGSNKMLQAMALLGDALKKDLVAEGVETESQASMLKLLGFRFMQGWNFGRPMTVSALRQYLENRRRAA